MMGNEENATGNCQHFVLFPQCFQKASLSGSLEIGLCRKELNSFPRNKISAI